MEAPENKYKLMDSKWMASYIDSLYEEFKIYGTKEDIDKIAPKAWFSTKHLNGLPFRGGIAKEGIHWIILEPNLNESDKHLKFMNIQKHVDKLSELYALQTKFWERNLTSNEREETKEKIDNLYELLFRTEKPLEEKKSFAQLLNKKGEQHLSEIVKLYPAYEETPKTQRFVYLLYVLFELNLSDSNLVSYPCTELHELMTDTFGKIGSRQGLGGAIKSVRDKLTVKDFKTIAEIDQRKEEIKKIIKLNKP